MVKILSFDIGIKNLAYCLLESNNDADVNNVPVNVKLVAIIVFLYYINKYLD